MVTTLTNCNFSTLTNYIPTRENPWNEGKVKHFYRRFAFGATPSVLKDALNKNPLDLIDELIDKAIKLPITPDPGWGYLDDNESSAYVGEDNWWIYLRGQFTDLILTDLKKDHIRGRMTMFMNGLFVSRWEKYIPYMYQTYTTKQKYALGNFKDFIHDMGLDYCMLRYLNNYENKAGNPNENYARELFELFTLGVDNGYTEQDIKETARAFTGYNVEVTVGGVIEFNKDTFDSDEKTIFGQTGNWNYDDVINILFEQKSDLIANYICTKLYQYFVSFTINEDIINEMSQTFLDNNFEFAPVLRQLFKSEHFFDENCIGVLIKSPLDLIMIHENELSYKTLEKEEISHPSEIFAYNVLSELEMDIVRPINVSGWPKHKSWIDSSTISERVSLMQKTRTNQFFYTFDDIGEETFVKFAKELFDINENVETVARGIVNFCLCKQLDIENEVDYQEAISIFKEGVPENYFTDGTWNLNHERLNSQVSSLLEFIISLPEYQLK